MAFSQLFRRYSTSNEQSTSNRCIDESSIAETLLDELESQCQNCISLTAIQNKRGSQPLSNSTVGAVLSTYTSSTNDSLQNRRHSSVDYSWLTPNNYSLQSANEAYQLSDIIKMELSELIRNVLAEDCTSIINQFRRHVRSQTKPSTPESIIALFRTTISDYVDNKSKNNRSNTNSSNDMNPSNLKFNNKNSSTTSLFGRTNRINPKLQPDDERHCIAELTEISVTSSSNDAIDNNKARK